MEKATQDMILNSIINKKLLSPYCPTQFRQRRPINLLPYNVKTLALLKNQDQEDFCARKQMKKTGNYCSKTILELEENQKKQ